MKAMTILEAITACDKTRLVDEYMRCFHTSEQEATDKMSAVYKIASSTTPRRSDEENQRIVFVCNFYTEPRIRAVTVKVTALSAWMRKRETQGKTLSDRELRSCDAETIDYFAIETASAVPQLKRIEAYTLNDTLSWILANVSSTQYGLEQCLACIVHDVKSNVGNKAATSLEAFAGDLFDKIDSYAPKSEAEEHTEAIARYKFIKNYEATLWATQELG